MVTLSSRIPAPRSPAELQWPLLLRWPRQASKNQSSHQQSFYATADVALEHGAPAVLVEPDGKIAVSIIYAADG